MLFLIGIIYLIEIPLYVVFIIIPLVLFIRFKYNIGSVLVILFFLFIFYYTPYSYYLEPSYWQFRNMCKLNELPNNEEKYNKILGYFDTDLESLDWEELNREAAKLDERSDNYIKDIVEYRVSPAEKKTRRIYGYVNLFANKNGFAPQNLTKINVHGAWYTRRYHLERESMASYNLTWFEDSIGCTYIIKRKFFQYQGDKQ
ncbi:hypothetical protein XJ32_02945 [Helicobacter bilis]|uniref:Uncharacterized protein n=1 Tax=Helicobacter bilis TaxID=37372 RepID=A0A1Q2LJV1_9HELI|nr:hypothetical protein XJ32_02945 [Helicobacter bilis]